jgi:hypothetical protein
MKRILIAVVALMLIGAGIGFYLYNMPHQNIERARAAFDISAPDLFKDFESDEQAANEKYLDEIVQVTGTVQGVETKDDGLVSVTLQGDGMFGVVCELDQMAEHDRLEFNAGEQVTLKGKCTGKLMDVVLVRCVEVHGE